MNGYKHQIKTCVWTRTLQVYWAASGRSSGFRRMVTDKKQPKKRSNITLRYYIYIYSIYIYYINIHTHFFYGLGGSYTDRPSISWYLSIPDMGQQQMLPPRTHFQRAPGHDLAATCPQRPQPTAQGKLRFERAGPLSGHGNARLWSTILIFLDAKKYWKPLYTSVLCFRSKRWFPVNFHVDQLAWV
jgi:hypothetical protein